jgi:hypothetical protein
MCKQREGLHINAEAAFELNRTQEALVVAEGRDAERVMLTLFGRRLPAGLLSYLPWQEGAPEAAVCWRPPDRLEIRVPDSDGWPDQLLARLAVVAEQVSPEAAAGRADFSERLSQLISRLEAWNYTDSEPGGGLQELAGELAALARDAPSLSARKEIQAAQDALDDGLPADAVTAALYRARKAGGGS